MKILIIGSGGREHTLAWKLAQSEKCSEIFIAPGNAGTALLGKNVDIPVMETEALLDFAKSEGIDFTVVGPDDVLANGLVDRFQEAGLLVFGPTQSAARLESSKIFSKEFMVRYGIPTAKAGSFDEEAKALEFLDNMDFPVVVKADGLALGKGVVIATMREEAAEAIHAMLVGKRFGAAGERILLEEFLTGQECSIHALVSGKEYVLFPPAQDHKQIYDGDQGPNTGGMGTFTPPPVVTEALLETIRQEVLDRFVEGLASEGIHYSGMLFPGMILTEQGPKVLEFNCRFGDPETQVLLRRLNSDLLELLVACAEGKLSEAPVEWDSRPAVCVVMASGGYPGDYVKGKVITGVEDAQAAPGVEIFHAGTARDAAGELVTSGGRVLGVSAIGEDLSAAIDAAYRAVEKISFEGACFRKDIGQKAFW